MVTHPWELEPLQIRARLKIQDDLEYVAVMYQCCRRSVSMEPFSHFIVSPTLTAPSRWQIAHELIPSGCLRVGACRQRATESLPQFGVAFHLLSICDIQDGFARVTAPGGQEP